MKTLAALSTAFGPCLLALSLSAGLASARATPLTATAAVQTQPSADAPIITYLKAGSEPVAPTGDAAIAPPPGWMAVALPGPFDGYVLNKDFTKGLEVKAGSSVYLAPKEGAGVLVVTAAGDKTQITGLSGKYTQISLEKPLVGYVQIAPSASSAPVAGAAPADPAMPAALPAPSAPIASSNAPGTAADTGEGGSALARTFEGRFVSTHHAFGPRRPYDWQLVDETGVRLAYLDVSKLLFTDLIGNYNERAVAVYGTVLPTHNNRDIVIAVESLQLK